MRDMGLRGSDGHGGHLHVEERELGAHPQVRDAQAGVHPSPARKGSVQHRQCENVQRCRHRWYVHIFII